MLPGFLPVVGLAASVVPLTLALHDSVTSSAGTLTVPATVQAGDLLVLLDFALNSSGSPTEAYETDFTKIGTASFSPRRLSLSYKIATGSEASTAIGSAQDGTSSDRHILAVFRASAPITSVVVNSVFEQGTNADPSPQNVTSASGDVPLVVLGAYAAASAISPRGFSPAEDGEFSPDTNSYLKYKIYNSSPADVTVDMEDEIQNYLISAYLEVE